MTGIRVAVWSLVLLACLVGAFFGGYYLRDEAPPNRPPRFTFIAAAPDEFHQAAIAGARAAAKEHDAELSILEPRDGTDQSTMLSGIEPKQVDGLVISPRSPRNQTRMLSLLAVETPVVTYDNDAPTSLRHCYVGTDNYAGGKLAGQLVREALPDGGKVAVLIGDAVRDNAQQRRLGLFDELLDRPRSDEDRPDPINSPIKGEKFTIVGTYLDDHDETRCRDNVKLALERHPDLALLVGLYGYVAPVCVKTLKQLERTGDVQVIGFDHHDQTLAGIESNQVFGAVVQDPYAYGFESVKMLAKWWRDPFTKPSRGTFAPYLIPCHKVNTENLADYKKQLAKQ